MSRRTTRKRRRRIPRRDYKICSRRYRPPRCHLGSAFERFCSKDCQKFNDAVDRLGGGKVQQIDSYEKFTKVFGRSNFPNIPGVSVPFSPPFPSGPFTTPSWQLTKITKTGHTLPARTITIGTSLPFGDSDSSGLHYSGGTG